MTAAQDSAAGVNALTATAVVAAVAAAIHDGTY